MKYKIYSNIKPSIGLDAISYAQDFVLKKIENRELQVFARKYNIPSHTLYVSAIGKSQPSYQLMLDLSEVIPITWWFTDINQQKPQKKILKSHQKVSVVYESVAFHQFMKMDTPLLIEYGLNYQFIRFLKNKTRQVILFSRIMFLKDIFKPRDWFIKK